MIYLYYRRYDDIENESITKITNIKRNEDDLCVFCLEGNKLSFYEYDDDSLLHTCDCRPAIHKECFYHLLLENQKCIICNKSIYKKLSNNERFRMNIQRSIIQAYQFTFSLLVICVFCKFVLFQFYIYFFI